MPDPLAPLVFQKVYQDTDSAIIETFTITSTTHVLGSSLSPAYPAGSGLIPKGAGPYADLGAPTTGATYTVGNLVVNGNYTWAVSLVTDWGETKPTNTLHVAAIGASVRGQTLNLPGYTGRADNPPRKLRIWRTTSGGSQLYLVAELSDLSVSSYVDEVDDSELTVTAPTSNTSGMIGVGAVDVYDGSTHWTEVALGTTLTSQHFSVDYTVTATGGTIHFAGADNGVNVTVTYFAGTFLGSAYLNQYWSALAGIHNWARVDATAEFSHSVQIDTDLHVLGSETIAGNLGITGTLGVTGASTLGALTSSSLHVTGTSALDGGVTAGSTLHVVGAGQFDSTLNVDGNTSLGGTLGVTGYTTLSGGMSTVGGGSFSGNVSVGGTLTVTGTTTLNATTTITAGGLNVVSGGFGLAGGGTIAGATAFTGLVTMGAGLHITGGPPDFQVANIFGSGGSTVTIGHSTSHQNLSVTGTTTLDDDVHLADPKTFFANYIDSETGSLVTFNNEMMVTSWFHPEKILTDKGSSVTVSDLSAGATICVLYGSYHTNLAGYVHFKPGAGTAAGDQFSINFSGAGVHSATPIVLLSQLTAGGNPVEWYIDEVQPTNIGSTSFIVAAKTAPTNANDYYIGYFVVN